MLETWKVAPALEAGIPDGVFTVVHGFGPRSAGETLTVNPAGELRAGWQGLQAAPALRLGDPKDPTTRNSSAARG
ncbi:hypothetical protein SAMN04488564_101281 [Lentzea waywayandensis]|uniref:Uncharacterized protein n=1 Tax=Lentzea waywayandensis TaxID=84724 RepID=A0A1I6CTJ0_9PSEU|nr:hypothetical protein [Lentzea waywayandensis]SFQ96510.1 hypothetical protein SAMN04488564_101281 [Lentzea waywayandensis]